MLFKAMTEDRPLVLNVQFLPVHTLFVPLPSDLVTTNTDTRPKHNIFPQQPELI